MSSVSNNSNRLVPHSSSVAWRCVPGRYPGRSMRNAVSVDQMIPGSASATKLQPTDIDRRRGVTALRHNAISGIRDSRGDHEREMQTRTIAHPADFSIRPFTKDTFRQRRHIGNA